MSSNNHVITNFSNDTNLQVSIYSFVEYALTNPIENLEQVQKSYEMTASQNCNVFPQEVWHDHLDINFVIYVT